ncbi:MAG: hypothetical protein EOP54_00250 [Sphingobacteriales bacterium]|nr:MAG: hypothetical protein EOP54_00250 [Sphingobacteriales bacterium]
MGVLLFLYLIAGVLLNYRSRLVWIGTAAIVFELAIIVVNGETSFMGFLQQGTDRLVNMSFLLPNILATSFTLWVAKKL